MAVGSQENNVKYCFKCGDPQHFARDCKKIGPFSCPIHKNATSHDKLACFLWHKANNMSLAPRPLSKERKSENPPGTQNDDTSSGATNKLRSLTNKDVKFIWTESHQKEFDYVIQNLSILSLNTYVHIRKATSCSL